MSNNNNGGFWGGITLVGIIWAIICFVVSWMILFVLLFPVMVLMAALWVRLDKKKDFLKAINHSGWLLVIGIVTTLLISGWRISRSDESAAKLKAAIAEKQHRDTVKKILAEAQKREQ
jgi:type VI protein secretion system component VasK